MARDGKKTNAPVRARVCPGTRAMLDLLSDGEPHDREEVLAVGTAAELGHDYNACVEKGMSARKSAKAKPSLRDAALSGARSLARNKLMIAARSRRILPLKAGAQVRMYAEVARAWDAQRCAEELRGPKETVAPQKYGQVTYYAGMPEWDGWAWAPLQARDVAHVRLVHPMPVREVEEAFPGWQVSESPEGLIAVSAHVGAPVKQVVQEWLDDNDIAHEGVRGATNVRRRDLNDLDPEFLHEVVTKSLPLANSVIAKSHRASMDVLTGGGADASGYVQLWVVELVGTFDAQLGRPFGTWVRSQIPYKVQDLNRAINGRTASDDEIRMAKAREVLESSQGGTASHDQLASALRMSRPALESKRANLAQLHAIRSAGTLDTSPDAPDVPVVDTSADPEGDALAREEAQRITLALLSAAGMYNQESGHAQLTRPMGFLAVYLSQWDDWVKSDLTHVAGCAAQKINGEIKAIHSALKQELADLAPPGADG